jgi:histidine ammonia-lyase
LETVFQRCRDYATAHIDTDTDTDNNGRWASATRAGQAGAGSVQTTDTPSGVAAS